MIWPSYGVLGLLPGMKQSRRRRCLACGTLYRPDPRSAYHQRYCSNEACQKASHQASQARWLRRETSRNYHRGPEACARVREWRAGHPKYWQHRPVALQDDCSAQSPAAEQDKRGLMPQLDALQDLYLSQQSLVVGLVALLTDTLQEDMVPVLAQLQTRGQAILGKVSPVASMKGVCTHDGS